MKYVLTVFIFAASIAASAMNSVDDVAAQALNSPTHVSVASSNLEKTFKNENKTMVEVVNDLANTDYFKTAKAVQIAEMQEKIQLALSQAEEAKAKAEIVKSNAIKEISQVSNPLQGLGSIEKDLEITTKSNLKIAEKNRRAAEQKMVETIKLNYISGDRAGITVMNRQTVLDKHTTKEGLKLIDVGSDFIKIKSKSGFTRTIYIVPDHYNQVQVITNKAASSVSASSY